MSGFAEDEVATAAGAAVTCGASPDRAVVEAEAGAVGGCGRLSVGACSTGLTAATAAAVGGAVLLLSAVDVEILSLLW